MNDYAQRKRNPTRLLVNLCVIVVLHVLLLCAINSGLAHKFVTIAKAPVEAMLIEEIKPVVPPSPPPPPFQPPSKNLPPPPAFVPPVEVPVNSSVSENAIVQVSNKPLSETPPSLATPPVTPSAPVVRTTAVVSSSGCKMDESDYPEASRRMDEEGSVALKFLIGTDGKVKESSVEKSSGFRRLDEAARKGLVAKCQFKPGTENGHPVESWASMTFKFTRPPY